MDLNGSAGLAGDAVIRCSRLFQSKPEKLWRKAETNGYCQRMTEIRVDCDADFILLQVEQTGAACPEGCTRCFFRSTDEGVLPILTRIG